MQGVHRHPARLDVGGTDDHTVDGGAPGGELFGEDLGLQRVVAAKGGVAPAGDDVGDVLQLRRHVQRGDDLLVAFDGVGLGQAASVGEDEERGGGLLQRPLQVRDRPAGQHRQVGDALGAGRVVVEHHQAVSGPDVGQRQVDAAGGRLVSEHPVEGHGACEDRRRRGWAYSSHW